MKGVKEVKGGEEERRKGGEENINSQFPLL